MDEKYVIFIEYGFGGIPNLHVSKFIKETDKTIKIEACDIESYSYRSVLNKKEDKYEIVTKDIAIKAIYFSKRYHSTYSEVKKILSEKYKSNILDLMEICGKQVKS